jgi:4-amino-4-deoxy-L-arabinose transferase-like glycosyltransferase
VCACDYTVAEREWREASDLRVPALNLLLVLAVAAALRFWGLGQGIPYAVGVDEPEIMTRVLRMMKTADFNPHFFDYPGLAFYLHLPIAVLRFLIGAISGRWRSLDHVGPVDFYLWGRALTALFGVATVYLTHQIGLRWGARHALLGAGLLAVLPMHVRESHFVLADVPATFFVALTFLLSLIAHERGTSRAFLWAGAAAGLAIATKYHAGVALLLPALAAWMTLHASPSRIACLLAVFAGALGAFLLAAPYTVLDLPGFLNGFAALASYYEPRGSSAEPGAIIYLKHLRLSLRWPAALLCVAGLVLAIVRLLKGPGRVRWTLLAAFPIVFFAAISGRSLIFGRYLLPLLPFVCMLAAIAVVSGVSLLRRFDIPRTPRRILTAALTVAAVLPPLLQSIGFDRQFSRPSTQQAAYEWITRNVPLGSRIVVEKHDLRLPEGRYRVDHVVRLTDREYQQYVSAGHQYLVATSQVFGPAFEAPHLHPQDYAAYRRLFDQSQELFVVKPDRGRAGPELRVYGLQPSSQ